MTCTDNHRFVVSRSLLTVVAIVVAVTITAGEAPAEIYRKGVFTGCSSPAEGTPGLDEGLAECNANTGAIGAFATAFVGAAGANALMYWNIPITPPDTDTQVDVDIDMIIAHGCAGVGAPQFTGTYLVYATGTESNQTRTELDAWLDTQIAVMKVIGVLSFGVPFNPGGSHLLLLELIQTANAREQVEEAWIEAENAEDAENIHMNFNYWVGDHQSSIKIWAGVRAQAAGMGLGTATATAAGVVRSIRISGIDPPVPVVVAGPDSVLPGHPARFQLSVPGNHEDVRYWIDWDDGQAAQETGWVPGDSVVTLYHTFNDVNSQYLVTAKAIEYDGLESGYTDHLVLCWDGKPNRVTGVTATDGEHCAMVAITWEPEGLAEWYTVWLESPGLQLSGTLIDTYYFEDTTAPPGVVRSYYVVAHNEHGESDSYDFDYGHSKDVPESAVSVDASADPCVVDIDWTGYPAGSGTNETDYFKIYRNDSDDFGTATVIDSIPGTCSSCSYEDVPDSTDRYYYWIVASNECGDAAPGDYSSTLWTGITPTSPAPVGASDDECGYVEVTWNNVTGFSYKVIRDGEYAHADYVTSPYRDHDAEVGVWHEYEVEAWNTSCTTGAVRAGPAAGIRYAYAQPPDNVAATDAAYCDRVVVTWDPVPDASRYEIYRDTDQYMGWDDIIATVAGDVLYYEDTGAPASGQTRCYRIVSFTPCDFEGSSFSDYDTGYRAQTIVSTPTGLLVTDSTYCELVKVEWNAAPDATHYSVYRDDAEIMQLGGTSYFDQSATPGVGHLYQITAHTPCYESNPTAQEPGTVVSQPPPAPGNVRATDKTQCERIEVSWDAVPGAAGYRIIRDGVTLVDSLISTSYLDSLVSVNDTYTYEVRSLNYCGEGAGESDTGRPGRIALAPYWMSASRGTSDEGVELVWTAGTSTVGYKVARDGIDIGTAVERYFIDRYAVPGQTYLYTVRSLTECGESGPSPADSGYIDSAAVMPRIVAEDVDLFQDTFPFDGAPTGVGRADVARDILPGTSPGILRGDSACVTVLDTTGLDEDPLFGGAAVYCWVSVHSPAPGAAALGRTGQALVDDASRWPVVDSAWAGGSTWYQVRMDTVFSGPGRSGPAPDRYCVDLNDNLFESGDTVLFFFHARTALMEETYWSEFTGQAVDWAAVAADPMEFQVLPGGGYLNGGKILYVNEAGDPEGVNTFQTAFRQLALEERVDRYDVRGAAAFASNSPGGSGAVGGAGQLVSLYDVIVWDTGEQLAGLLGDGTGVPEKADDFRLLYDFLEQRDDNAGVYLCGDNLAGEWESLAGVSAADFRGLISHNVTSRYHWNCGLGVPPLVYGVSSGPFYHASSADSLYVYYEYDGGDGFDVLAPTGAATRAMRYAGGASATENAVITQTGNNPYGHVRTVVLSGFSFWKLRDHAVTGISERAHHLSDILSWLGEPVGEPVDVKPTTPRYADRLGQNRPNPFNPTTTIEFSLRAPAHATLTVYNVKGQVVRVLLDEPRAAGPHEDVVWDGRNAAGDRVASGIYFYRLVAGAFADTRKMVLLK